ncbi:MAG: sensor histidine kinase [Desulfobacteraceae bacterium]|nr:MAG: sensor histidine kinase [Desulfobacteraceae bacterium]
MGSLIKKKLFYQTLAFILPFVVFSIFLTSVALSLSNKRFFQKTIHQDYANIIQTASGSISRFLDNSQRSLESLALVMASLKLDPWQKEIALTAFLHQNPQFSAIDLISPQDSIAASPEPADLRQPEQHQDLLDRALSGGTAVSKAMADGNELPYAYVYVPVRRQGKTDELLRARLSLKFIWDILEDIRIGEKGHVYVMDGSGRLIAHRDIQQVLQPAQAITPEDLNAIRKTAGPLEWVGKNDGAFYNLGVYIPGPDWIVMLTQPRSEVYEYLRQNIFWAALMSLLIAMGAVFLGWRGSRRLLAPIQALHLHVQDMGRGDLDRKIAIGRVDEIGDLGNAFNEMTDSLKKYVDREVETARTLAHTKNLATLGTVASKVSHEMGNFLFGIQMMMNGLKKEPLTPNGLGILKTIENEVAQTRTFTKDFMNFAKKPALKFVRRSLDGLIREVLDILRPEADGHEIGVTLNWDPAIPPIRMDTELMKQVFTNLIKNSLEAMNGAGNLTITGKAAGETILVSVADTGPGMDPEISEKLFEPFVSTKGVLGTGLGLAIVKSNIEVHGGTIECVSAPGKGAEFLIRLPME